MYQSLDHDEVVVLEIKRDEPPNIPRTIRVSLGDNYSQWTQEIITTTIQTGGENISSKNIEGKWTQGDTLALCFSGVDNHRQMITINVVERTHTIVPDNCFVENR